MCVEAGTGSSLIDHDALTAVVLTAAAGMRVITRLFVAGGGSSAADQSRA
jgi:hypothetical protein